jgi:hypothetical protein
VCSGFPEHWLTPQLPTDSGAFLSTIPNDERKIINIGVNITTTPSTTKNEVIERGAIVALLAYLLEQSGRSVTITQYCAFSKENHNFYGSVPLKLADEYINLDLLSFWLTSPDCLRKCWTHNLKGIQYLVDNNFNFPITDFGSEFSDVFIPGLDVESGKWQRKNSLDWVKSSLKTLNINYDLAT